MEATLCKIELKNITIMQGKSGWATIECVPTRYGRKEAYHLSAFGNPKCKLNKHMAKDILLYHFCHGWYFDGYLHMPSETVAYFGKVPPEYIAAFGIYNPKQNG